MQKKEELYRGKTKAVFATDDPSKVIMENFNALTKHDDPSLTKEMKGKAIYATNTTCNVFELLKAAGLPVAYHQRLSEKEFLVDKCKMIPLEVIIRRYAVGSYLERFPHLKNSKEPHRFHRLKFELFLKTKDNKVFPVPVSDKEEIGLPLPISVEDPLINIMADGQWKLLHPKKPVWDKESALGCEINPEDLFPGSHNINYTSSEVLKTIEPLARQVFLLLEGAWAQLGFRLIDFKLEFGIGSGNRLMIADVIDNDSWRLRTSDWQEVSKECFRQNAGMEEINDKYAMVSKLSERFHLPKQAVVVWRGSADDEDLVPEYGKTGILETRKVILSGHKSPGDCLKKLEKVLAEFPEGGVIVAMVGMSNGLGPILAARTSWPVISVPLTIKTNAEDVWSSLRAPSKVPNLTVLSHKNAFLAALNIMAQKNPLAYMLRQFELETLDE